MTMVKSPIDDIIRDVRGFIVNVQVRPFDIRDPENFDAADVMWNGRYVTVQWLKRGGTRRSRIDVFVPPSDDGIDCGESVEKAVETILRALNG